MIGEEARQRTIELLSYSARADHVAPRDARAAVAVLEGLVSGPVLDDLQLLITELVTNSIKHGAKTGTIDVRATCEEDRVRVEVTDQGSEGAFAMPLVEGLRESGYGLFLVDRVARRWGVDRDGTTTVWFELDL